MGADLVRTRSGKLVPRAQVETPVAPAKGASVTRLTVGALALLAVLGLLVGLLAAGDGRGKGSRLDSILKDVGYVVQKQKGIGIQR